MNYGAFLAPKLRYKLDDTLEKRLERDQREFHRMERIEMAAEFTELMGIILYLLLTLGGGAVVALFAILLIILLAASSLWVATQVSGRKRTSQFG